jgi:acetyl-CoA carboxylase biotin carboxyl carrier protein
MSKKGDLATDSPADEVPGDLAPENLVPENLAVDGTLVRSLAALLAETGLSEIEYAVGDRRIRVARNAVPAGPLAPMAPAATTGAPSAAAPAAASLAAHPGAVKAPMVGTVYLSPQPEAPPFAKLGDTVNAGQPLLIIEAMKVMNQIRAPRAGRLVQILVEDGAPVEYGEVVMVLE